MAAEKRPRGYPKLKNYQPSRFMLLTSHYDKAKADRWNATQMVQNLEGDGFTMVPFGQGFASMSGPTKDFTGC